MSPHRRPDSCQSVSWPLVVLYPDQLPDMDESTWPSEQMRQRRPKAMRRRTCLPYQLLAQVETTPLKRTPWITCRNLTGNGPPGSRPDRMAPFGSIGQASDFASECRLI